MGVEGWRETILERVPEAWEICKLGEVATLINGRAYKNSEFKTKGTPIVRIQNLKGSGSGKVVYSDLQLPEEKYIEYGDLIYAWSATFGPHIWKGPKSIYHYHIWKIENRSDIVDKHFLYYKLQLISDKIKQQGTGSIFSHITKTLMENQEIGIPSLNEQKQIAAILSALDEKIELNHRINQNLEAMAQALFQSWFVDFEPFRNGEFVKSELGLIPKGWEVKKLVDVTTYLKRGIAPKYIESGGIQVINQKCVRDCKLSFNQARRHDPTKRKVEGRYIEIGDVLVNSTGIGTLGRVAPVYHLSEPSVVDTHVTVVRANNTDVLRTYLGQYMIRKQPETELLGEGSTGQTELSRTRLGELMILVPDLESQKTFGEMIQPLIDQQISHMNQINTLTQLRDTLLPKLMSGEIRVPIEHKEASHERTDGNEAG